MKQAYINVDFKRDTLELIDTINGIIDDYMGQGYTLTVRQLYYQLVARAIIENTERSYKRTTSIVNDGRLAGLIDWDAIEDRTREFVSRPRWSSGSSIIEACASQFHKDMWADQDTRVFCIVEKEALAGVLEQVCHGLDVPLLAARGYPSGTVLREFCQRDLLPVAGKQDIVILHLGDHDPSGIDMSRDLEQRIGMFLEGEPFDIMRIALNMPQIEELKPPPNPAKITDARFDGYRRRFGSKSWELDALSPEYLTSLVKKNVMQWVDKSLWEKCEREIERIRSEIKETAESFTD